MRAFVSTAHCGLLRAIRKVMASEMTLATVKGGGDRHLPTVVIEGLHSEPWASATFTGHKHWVELRLHGPTAQLQLAQAEVAARLQDADLSLKGHILADIALVHADLTDDEHDGAGTDGNAAVCRLTFEALTIED